MIAVVLLRGGENDGEGKGGGEINIKLNDFKKKFHRRDVK